jgi:hypothetical protein
MVSPALYPISSAVANTDEKNSMRMNIIEFMPLANFFRFVGCLKFRFEGSNFLVSVVNIEAIALYMGGGGV